MRHHITTTLLLITLAGTTLLSSCDLETEPTTALSADAIFKTTEDAEKVLNGAWETCRRPIIPIAHRDGAPCSSPPTPWAATWW